MFITHTFEQENQDVGVENEISNDGLRSQQQI